MPWIRASTCCLLLALMLAACGDEQPSPGGPTVAKQPAPEKVDDAVRDEAGELASTLDPALVVPDLEGDARAAITVDYPHDESVFPPGFVPPTFLWHDDAEGASTWWIRVGAGTGQELVVRVPHRSPPQGRIDPEARGPTNELYEPTPYQASAHAWTPSPAVWKAIQARSTEAPVTITFLGADADTPERALSKGTVRITTSKDEVGAPIFYRDVPLMPGRGEDGRIQPLAPNATSMIAWRLKDVTRTDDRVVLTGMPSCANCHSFSKDGKTLGMDVDGPDSDKGMYALAPIQPTLTISKDDVLTWNAFPDKPEGHRTIGFLSRVSPDGQWVVSTVNEELYVRNFEDHRFLQVFFPTRGILGLYSAAEDRLMPLPGADDPAFVHCDGVWSPDGAWIVFARAPAKDPYVPGRPLAQYAGDPNETQIRYDLYRMPFNGGQGGTPVAIEGASQNGMSNTFPKVSPDGRWIVYVKCKNGQLMRPDGKLWIVPFEGGEAREMRCNTDTMNSWHSFSPNSRWMVFTSKVNTPYTQMFLTHIDEDGSDSPAILIPNATAANRAAW